MAGSEGKTYRTAGKASGTSGIPGWVAVITDPGYRYATSLVREGKAYLQPLNQALQGETGRLFLEGKDGTIEYDGKTGNFKLRGFNASAAELRDFYTNRVPDSLDLPFLQLCFSILLYNFWNRLQDSRGQVLTACIYYPALARAVGKAANISRSDVVSFIRKLLSYQSVMGYIDGEIQPVLLYLGEDSARNTVSFASPYLTKVLRSLYESSIRKDSRGNPKLKQNGQPQTRAVLSYIVNACILKERNKRAVENVFTIVSLIETAGNGIPHIKAGTLIERNPLLRASLEGKSRKHQNQVLERTFRKTWELLREQTALLSVYRGIELPDPDDPGSIPSMSSLDMVFRFPHKGKRGNGQISEK